MLAHRGVQMRRVRVHSRRLLGCGRCRCRRSLRSKSRRHVLSACGCCRGLSCAACCWLSCRHRSVGVRRLLGGLVLAALLLCRLFWRQGDEILCEGIHCVVLTHSHTHRKPCCPPRVPEAGIRLSMRCSCLRGCGCCSWTRYARDGALAAAARQLGRCSARCSWSVIRSSGQDGL